MDLDRSDTLLSNFFKTGKKLNFNKKDTIIKYDDTHSGVYYIESGTVKVVTHTKSGTERIHYIYKENELFPLSYVLGNKDYDITFVAFTDTVMSRKSIDEFIKFLKDEPYSMYSIIQQQMQVYDRIFNLNLAPSLRRVITHLQSLADRFGVKQGDEIVIELPITIQAFADNIRLSREKTGKILSDLEDEDCIMFNRRKIILYPKNLEIFIKNNFS